MKLQHVPLVSLFFLALALPCLGAPSDDPGELPKPKIRLPAIFHRWGSAEDEGKPAITMEEIERCMGKDLALQERLERLKRQQADLEKEYSSLKDEVEAIDRESDTIKSEQERVAEAASAFGEVSNDLESRNAAIEKKKTKAKLTARDAKEINKLIDVYNADVAQHNKKRLLLLQEQETLRGKINIYNEKVNAANSRSASYESRNGAFREAADRFDKEIAGYQTRCTGEKVLRK